MFGIRPVVMPPLVKRLDDKFTAIVISDPMTPSYSRFYFNE